jgi:hypothetical protein
VLGPFLTSPDGRASVSGHWPPGVPGGATLTFQFWIQPALPQQGWGASPAVRFTVP